MSTQTSSITVVPTHIQLEGGGFTIRRAFPVGGLSYFDPILLIDEMGPVTYGPGDGIGAPDHPHRGFETVTYVIEGSMEHEDSHGHRGSLNSGDVQWMTAGAGVIHSEMPSKQIMDEGGTMHGFQIWVNLPKSEKLATPRYQEYASDGLPIVTGPGTWARVIAGELNGQRSPIETTVPTTMMHVKLEAGAELAIPVPAGANAIVHTIEGQGAIDRKTALTDHQVALIANAAATITLTGGDGGFEALVLAGMPLNEPVARYGPFVMNTKAEIETAFRDYQAGRFGEIARTN